MPPNTRKKRARRHRQSTPPKTPSKPGQSKFERGFQILLTCLKLGYLLIWVMGKDGLTEKLTTVIDDVFRGKEE